MFSRSLRRHQYLEPIVFNDYYDPCKLTLPCTSVIVLDSVNAENNITGEWTEATRTAFLDCVQDAYDAMMDAQARKWMGMRRRLSIIGAASSAKHSVTFRQKED